ncbi:MAG TPA: hypothetical protein DEQ64_24950 [Lachnoclostridium sp.]|uniref:Gfo/Idh/MocA family protein n=1 Tax=Lacrimispora sp. TaxID=2719234 RepID=UPI000EBB971E|nr:Gfo/Idh/MocA family oxidoreductase [Lacrimispora sp.]HCD46912.1 hypothetical protein [Lachnoclostridium sp.]
MLRIGIAGLGVISEIHRKVIGSLQGEAKVTAVCDCDIRKKEKALDAVFYTDLAQMLKIEKLDCLHICLPHHLHVPAAKLAASMGVSVFMEKPAGLNTEDIDSLLPFGEAGRIHLGVCLQHRYDASVRKMLKILEEGSYGKLKGCKAVVTWNRTGDYYNRDPWRGKTAEAGGGVMLSQAIHIMDLMELFCGKPVWTKGMTGNLFLEDIEVEDTACSFTMFEHDVHGVFYGTVTHCRNSSTELEITTEKGIFFLRNDKLTVLEDGQETVLAEECEESKGKDYYGYSHSRAIREFYHMLAGNGGSFISLEEARKVSVLIDKIWESAETGKRVYW